MIRLTNQELSECRFFSLDLYQFANFYPYKMKSRQQDVTKQVKLPKLLSVNFDFCPFYRKFAHYIYKR